MLIIVARTIADLAECEEIQSVHLAALTMCFAKALHASQPAEVDVELNISHKTEDLRSKSSAGCFAKTHAKRSISHGL